MVKNIFPHSDKRPSLPIFKIALKNYFTSTSSDYGLRTENSRSLSIKAIFAIFRILIFSSKSRVFSVFFCVENCIFMIELQVLGVFPKTTSCGLVDKF